MKPIVKATATLVSGLLAGCSILTPLPDRATVDQRLAAFPTEGLPISAPVTVYWDNHQVPFVVAETDSDLAFALGLVHAHLRLGQMEILRLISKGRLSEVAGPLAVDIDHSLRIIDFGRVAAKVEREMPRETRVWLEAFVNGVNHYVKTTRIRPHEFKVLGIRAQPWTVRDVITIGRVASTDVNWLAYFRMLRLRKRKDWPTLWQTLARVGGDSTPSFGKDRRAQMMERILGGTSRSGSNSVAIAARRSKSGGALLANDPHLGISMPNLWLIAGMKSPGYHAVGLMIPGIPFVAVGRNPHIAWGGTNMRAASSDLYDVSKLPKRDFTIRREKIYIRWWLPQTVNIRETPLGPVISDAPPLNWKGPPLALRWIGHERGDEITAMLKVARATSWQEFRDAFTSFAVSAQNMLYADTQGNIGQLMATILPVRKPGVPKDFILDGSDPQNRWRGVLNVLQLPSTYNPAAGFVASANNRPTASKVPIGYMFSADDRIDRMKQLVGTEGRFGIADLKALQRDVYMSSAVGLRDAMLRQVDASDMEKALDPAARRLVGELRGWDGHYRVASKGAVAFELTYFHFSRLFYSRRFGDEDRGAYTGFGRIKRLLREEMARAPAEEVRADLRAALAEAAKKRGDFPTWGDMHRLGLAHPLAFVPVLGGKYRFGDFPVPGSTDTLMKTAHSATDGRHFTRYGQQARHISDLSDLDKNYFVLLGGQDGWLSSETALDQVTLWRKGDYVQVPMRVETVRKRYSRRITLRPKKN